MRLSAETSCADSGTRAGDGMITGYIPPSLVSKAKEMDLLTYLQIFEPNELVRISDHEYCTRTHDSLKISNGKWMWWSRGVGGKNAVDYLVTVEEKTFYEAVKTILDYAGQSRPPNVIPFSGSKDKHLIQPRASPNNDVVKAYLISRGISETIINDCIENGSIYESLPYHNVVFVGFDESNNPKYAGLRGTINSDYKGDACGSDKKYSFRYINPNADTVHIFEGAIDLLSYATLLQMQGKEYKEYSLLTLAGVYNAKQYLNIKEVPVALSHFLKSNPQIKTIYLHLDNDIAGRNATKSLIHLLSDSYKVEAHPPPKGKDVNDYLCYSLRLPITKSKSERREAR